MKKLSIPSAMVGLMFGLIATVFVYLFVPPPSTASADDCDCPSAISIAQAVGGHSGCATDCATEAEVKKWCYLMHNY